jgi:hypothetical protein
MDKEQEQDYEQATMNNTMNNVTNKRKKSEFKTKGYITQAKNLMFEVTMCKRESRKWAQAWVSPYLSEIDVSIERGR